MGAEAADEMGTLCHEEKVGDGSCGVLLRSNDVMAALGVPRVFFSFRALAHASHSAPCVPCPLPPHLHSPSLPPIVCACLCISLWLSLRVRVSFSPSLPCLLCLSLPTLPSPLCYTHALSHLAPSFSLFPPLLVSLPLPPSPSPSLPPLPFSLARSLNSLPPSSHTRHLHAQVVRERQEVGVFHGIPRLLRRKRGRCRSGAISQGSEGEKRAREVLGDGREQQETASDGGERYTQRVVSGGW